MGLTFFDQESGVRREFRASAPPSVGISLSPSPSLREAVTAESLRSALMFLGMTPVPGDDIRVGGHDAAGASTWLKVASVAGAPDGAALAARGFTPADFRALCLKTHYRRPFTFAWESLAAARAEAADLRAAARALAGTTEAPSAAALAGYLHRFREALCRDLDLPDALAGAWAGLRPGALSPGSRAAFIRTTLPALGL